MRGLFSFFKRDREKLVCTVKIHFLPDDQVVPQVEWRLAKVQEQDWLRLLLFFYARIVFELAEMNESRVARELLDYVRQIARKLAEGGNPVQIPLGKLRFSQELPQPGQRIYRARLWLNRKNDCRLELEGLIGKERFYYPASFLALLQLGINSLSDSGRLELARRLERLHRYYRFKRDFWDSRALTAGPLFALGNEKLGEVEPEIGTQASEETS